MRLATSAKAMGSSQITGMGSKSTSLCDSLSTPPSRSQPAPCKNMPWRFTPFSGSAFSSPTSRTFVVLEKNSNASMGIFVLRECNCNAAVMKPCGKKKQGSQKLFGGPFMSQSTMNLMRRMKSSTHEFKGFMHGYATLVQLPGTFCTKKELYMPSKSADIKTMPLIALPSILRLALMTLIIFWKREYSWPWKTPMEMIPPPAIFLYVVAWAIFVFAASGIALTKASAMSEAMSSGLLPPPAEAIRGCTLITVSMNFFA
mmetsp:Transcript_57223/g.123077  ORF Transcript_57223/g.123077 Transcript_57223/m.123077 type:complete len:258 (-) Transcript_57223:3736-4509(-)